MPGSCTVCVFAVYLAVTVSTGLVTVGVEAFIGVTVTWSTGGRSPPTPGTLMVNSTHTPTVKISKKSKQRQKATELVKIILSVLFKGIISPFYF